MTSDPQSSRSAGRVLRASLVIGLTTLVLFEATLQVAAFGLWARYRTAPRIATATDQSVLCIGDSYTFGIGASSTDQSYPAQLERVLRGESSTWKVFNGGWPGRNSREALAALDADLTGARPSLVYILVGTNDFWTRPERLDSGVKVEPSGEFKWRWRTARLAALVASAGRELMSRRRSGATAIVGNAPGEPGQTTASPAATDQGPTPRVRTPEEARALASAESARTLAFAGKRAEAAVELGRLRAALDASGQSEVIGEAFAATAVQVGEDDQALAVARELSNKYPDNVEFLRIVAWESYLRRDHAAALDAVDRALSLGGAHSDQKRRALLLRIRTLILFDGNRRQALESGVLAFLADGDGREFRLLLQRDVPTYTPALVDDVLDDLRVEAGARQQIKAIVTEARTPSSEVTSVLAFHLRQMVAGVDAAGQRAVLLSYPFPSPANRVARDVAAEMGAGWIDIETEFANRLMTAAREDFFVADGHLNDRGYRIVGELVARDVKHRLMGAPPLPRPQAPWIFDLRGKGNAATLSVLPDGNLKVDISRADSPNLWDIQLRWPKLKMIKGTTYEVSFMARAGVERDMAFGMNSHEFQSIGLFQQVRIGPTWQTFRQSFIAESSDPDAELHLDFGGSPVAANSQVSVELNDIVVRRLPDGALVEPNSP